MQTARLSKDLTVDLPARTSGWDDLSRNVYCVLGIPIDAIDMPGLLRTIECCVSSRMSFLVSTANLNFLVKGRRDPQFRETLLFSELCTADGMPIVWIARLLGLPIKDRVAGSDMLGMLKSRQHSAQPLKFFLFGGAEGVGDAAARAMNAEPNGLRCVGSIYPGFGSIEDMSQNPIIDAINASNADFLLVALGANKGQQWLQHNHDRLRIPVRAHLGATINFLAGHVRRAPLALRKSGLEWLWRIKEEPHLWRRYWSDGVILLGLLVTRVLPLAVRLRWQRLINRAPQDLVIEPKRDRDAISLSLCGAALAPHAERAIAVFRDALANRQRIHINLAKTCDIDARFLGLLLMLRKLATRQNTVVEFIGASRGLRRVFDLNGAKFLLTSDQS